MATINFPAMVPGVTLKTQPGMPYVRFLGILGIVPDLVHTPDGYRPVNPDIMYNPLMIKTDWMLTANAHGGSKIEIRLGRGTLLDDSGTLVLLAGVEFGNNLTSTEILAKRGAGGGKILAVG